MEKILSSELSEDEERIQILRLKTLKEIDLKQFSSEIKNKFNKIIDELVCEIVFKFHMELRDFDTDPYQYSLISRTPDASLLCMGEELNILKVNQDIDCPKCFMLVKCLWLSKHLAGCMHSEDGIYTYSCRNSSRIARQRIQEGFKTSYDESKNDSEDEKIKPKRRSNKGRKAKTKVAKSHVKRLNSH